MLNDCLHCTARSLRGEIDHTHDIRNEMACHMELFSLPLLGERERERSNSTSVPDIGLLTTGVTMDMCSGLETHATVLRVRWMTINHLIYERNSVSVACLLTCNNVTTPQQLRKMPGKGVAGCSQVKIQFVAVGWAQMHCQYFCVWIWAVSRYSCFYLFDAFGFKALTVENCHPQAYEAYGLIGFGFTEIQIWEMGWKCGRG